MHRELPHAGITQTDGSDITWDRFAGRITPPDHQDCREALDFIDANITGPRLLGGGEAYQKTGRVLQGS